MTAAEKLLGQAHVTLCTSMLAKTLINADKKTKLDVCKAVKAHVATLKSQYGATLDSLDAPLKRKTNDAMSMR